MCVCVRACVRVCFHWSLLCIVDDDDETATNSESVVSKSHLSELCSEAAKLKSMGVMNQVALSFQHTVCILSVLCLP